MRFFSLVITMTTSFSFFFFFFEFFFIDSFICCLPIRSSLNNNYHWMFRPHYCASGLFWALKCITTQCMCVRVFWFLSFARFFGLCLSLGLVKQNAIIRCLCVVSFQCTSTCTLCAQYFHLTWFFPSFSLSWRFYLLHCMRYVHERKKKNYNASAIPISLDLRLILPVTKWIFFADCLLLKLWLNHTRLCKHSANCTHDCWSQTLSHRLIDF